MQSLFADNFKRFFSGFQRFSTKDAVMKRLLFRDSLQLFFLSQENLINGIVFFLINAILTRCSFPHSLKQQLSTGSPGVDGQQLVMKRLHSAKICKSQSFPRYSPHRSAGRVGLTSDALTRLGYKYRAPAGTGQSLDSPTRSKTKATKWHRLP